ncbi:MAG: DUF4157 domain-containing protein [Acidimicrobiales bacterium]
MHLRTNEIEGDQLATNVRVTEEERAPATAGTDAADTRARVAVGAGRVGSLDAAGTRSLQRLAGNAAVSAALQRRGDGHDDLDGSGVHDAVGRSGEKLDEQTSNRLSQGFGVNPSGVELVRDDASTTGVQAKAYTVGSKIVVPSSFDSSSTDGQRTLAHEFTHVQQQSAGPVDGTPAAGGVSVSSPSDRYEVEAESNADRVMGGGFADVAQAGISSSGLQRQAQAAPVQREEAPEDEVQTLRVQREAETGEEETEGE